MQFRVINPVFTLLFSTVLLSIASCMVIPYYAVILAKQLHMPALYIGCVLGVANFCQFGFSIFGIKLQFKLGSYNSLILSLLLRLAGFMLIATNNYLLTISGILISAVGAALYFPIAKGVILQYSDNFKSSSNLALFNASLNFGMLIGPILVAILFYMKQERFVIHLSNCILAILIIINLIFLSTLKCKNSSNKQITKISINKNLRYLLILQLVFVTLFIGYQNFIMLYLTDIDPNLYTVVATSTCIVNILQPLFVRKIQQHTLQVVIFYSFLLLGAGFLLFTIYSQSYFQFISVFVASAIIIIAEIIFFLKIDCVVATLYKESATYILGVLRCVSGFGLLIGNICSGFIYGVFSIQHNYYWLAMSTITFISYFFLMFCVKDIFGEKIRMSIGEN